VLKAAASFVGEASIMGLMFVALMRRAAVDRGRSRVRTRSRRAIR